MIRSHLFSTQFVISFQYFLQYWYSNYTINQMAEDCVNVGGRIAFLSTPSIYFALPDAAREKSFCFDVSIVKKYPVSVSHIILIYIFFFE